MPRLHTDTRRCDPPRGRGHRGRRPLAPHAQEPRAGRPADARVSPGRGPGSSCCRCAGAQGDSIRAILERDLDFGDRVSVVALPAARRGVAGARRRPADQLGAARAAGRRGRGAGRRRRRAGVTVTVHDVGRQAVLRFAEFPLRGAPSEPRLASERARRRRRDRGMAHRHARHRAHPHRLRARRGAVRRGQRRRDGDGDSRSCQPPLSPAWHPGGTRARVQHLRRRVARDGARLLHGARAHGELDAGRREPDAGIRPRRQRDRLRHTGEDGNAELYRGRPTGGAARGASRSAGAR